MIINVEQMTKDNSFRHLIYCIAVKTSNQDMYSQFDVLGDSSVRVVYGVFVYEK